MIFRTVHNSQNPYFQMNKASVNDKRLSYKAVGIHAYLMSKPDNWLANEVDLTNRHDDGKASVRAGVQELIQHGYMTRVQVRKENKIIGWRLDTYETPELNPSHREGDQPEFVIVDLDSENQNVADLDSDFLDVEKQDVGKQDVGNRNTNKERVLVSNDSNKNENSSAPVSLPTSKSTGDPMMDAAKAKQERRQKQGGNYVQDWQVDLNKKVDAKLRVGMANKLASMFGLSAKMENDDKTLRTMHEQVAMLYQMGYTTMEKMEALYALWMADDWRKKNKDKLTVFKFTDFASQKKHEEEIAEEARKPKIIRIINQYTGQVEERHVNA